MVEEVATSGQPIAVVARRHGVHATVLGRWCHAYGVRSARRFGPVSEKRKDGPDLIPVRLVAPEILEDPGPQVVADTRVSSVIEIHLSNGCKVVVPEDIPPARLQDLLSVVAGR
jgi:transposase-like protein